MLMKEFKEDLRDIPCAEVRRFNIEKISIFPKLIHRFNTIPIKIPVKDFCRHKIGLF